MDLIESLKQRVKFLENEKCNLDEVSWNYQEGIIISGNNAKKIINMDKELKIVHECLTELYEFDSNVEIIKKTLNKIETAKRY